MKTTLKLTTLLVALASVFTFSSCLDSDSNSTRANYYSYVTITGDDAFGYTFHADFGSILKPTSASVQEVLPGLGKSNAKRAYIAFDLASEAENGKNLEAGKTYDIILRADYMANYAVPTYNTIDIAGNAAATDSLSTKNERVNSINNNIWAINGYVNAQMSINYDPNKPFYVNTYYDSEKDVDIDQKTLNLNIYYNSNSNYALNSGNSVFSFKLPEREYIRYANSSTNPTQDSIKVILNAITGDGNKELTKVGECKMAIKDFYLPRSY